MAAEALSSETLLVRHAQCSPITLQFPNPVLLALVGFQASGPVREYGSENGACYRAAYNVARLT
jgi:hypothetical protein